MGQAKQSTYNEHEKQAVVRRILLGRSTLMDEANKFHISTRSVEEWLNDGRLRNGIRITAKSNWHPTPYPREFKEQCVMRVKRGESPANIARERIGLLPGTIRNWSLGIDMEEVDMQTTESTTARSSRPIPPRVAPRPVPAPPEPEPAAAPARHPNRDEAVEAFRSGMPIADIIKTLELTVTADAIRDWDAEDRLADKLSNKGGLSSDNTSRYTEDQKRAAVDRVLAGENPHSIAEELGCSSRLLRIWCDARIQTNKAQRLQASEKEVESASRHRVGVGGSVSPYTEEQQRDACERVAKGYDVDDVADQMNINRTTIYAWARKHGIRLEPVPVQHHTEEFKVAAAARVLDKGERNGVVARSLKVSEQSVSLWVTRERHRRATLAQAPAPTALPTPRRGGHGGSVSGFTDAQKRAAVQRWIDGEDKDAISDELGINPQTLRHWGYDFEMPLPTHRRYREDHPARIEAIRRMVEDGVEPDVIAEEMGFDRKTAFKWRRDERNRLHDIELGEMKAAYEAKKKAEAEAAAAPKPAPEPPKFEAVPTPPEVKRIAEQLDAAIVETRYQPPVAVPLPHITPAPAPNGKLKIDISDPHTRRVWETALAAALEEQQRVHGLQPSPSWERPKIQVPSAPPAPPVPAPVVAATPPAPRKARAVQMLQCPECNGQFAAPPPLAGGFEITQGRCPNCKVVIEI